MRIEKTYYNEAFSGTRIGSLVVALAALTTGSAVQAQSEEDTSFGTFGGSLTIASDYMFRGVSNSNSGPQIQGDMNWSHGSGVYAGIWATNTNFGGAGNSMELDPYVGFASSVGDTGFSYDVGYWSYNYPHGDSGIDYGEFYAIGTYAMGDLSFSPSVWYADSYFGNDYSGLAYDLTVSHALPWEMSASARVGEQTFHGGGSAGDGMDYLYYDVGVTKTAGDFSLGLRWHDTQDASDFIADEDLIDGRVVFNITRSF